MSKSTTVEAVRPPVVAEFKVKYTCLDDDGDQQMGEDPCTSGPEAADLCAGILEYQERYGLPVDAHIVFRIYGGPWHRWGGESR